MSPAQPPYTTQVAVWPSQSEFLRAATKLAERLFATLGVEPMPALALVAVPGSETDSRPPVVETTAGLRWIPRPAEWLDEIVERTRHPADRSATRALRSAHRTLAFYDVAQARLREHDRRRGTRSFLSQAARIWEYDVAVAIELDRRTGRGNPAVRVRTLRRAPVREVSLLRSAVEAFLGRVFEELSKGSNGMRGWVGQRDVDDLRRDAGERLLRAVQWSVREVAAGANLFEQLNAISNLAYEGAEPRGGLVFGPAEDLGPLDLSFGLPVPLAESVWARKMLQMASAPFWAACDAERLLGLVRRGPGGPAEFRVRFLGQSAWELSHKSVVLANVRLGLPSFPIPRLRAKDFEVVFCRVFSDAEEVGIRRVWALIDAALKQGRGTMVVVARDAAIETERLVRQATPVRSQKLGPEVAFQATAIDGAILLDASGACHAVGVILDGPASDRGTPARGARFNAAVRYVNAGSDRLAVVVSEDGQVDLFPRLRPPIARSELDLLLQQVRDCPRGPLLAELSGVCLRLARYYLDYVPEDLREYVVAEALAAAGFTAEDGTDAVVGQFDRHPSDFT